MIVSNSYLDIKRYGTAVIKKYCIILFFYLDNLNKRIIFVTR